MTVRVGVVGVGAIGVEHIGRLDAPGSGARVVAVADAAPGRADAVAATLPGAVAAPGGEALIASPEVDAVTPPPRRPSVRRVVAAHEPDLHAALKSGTREPVVLREKPPLYG